MAPRPLAPAAQPELLGRHDAIKERTDALRLLVSSPNISTC
jgi:hypothetical protein